LEQNATIKVIHFDRPYYPVILELSSTSDNRGQGELYLKPGRLLRHKTLTSKIAY